MKSKNEQENNKLRNLEDALQKNTDHKGVSGQIDGFRYDYDDSADIRNEDSD
ncbi:hypothetical protein ACFYKX_19705 [Cytobacillus sp. FJAT-54145]|uniref:DUF4025 domain-containing protein n=1 Tax=Cytobacillus spartinae TaxID=3299023 RepID=A0ABW6KGI0_9BACI